MSIDCEAEEKRGYLYYRCRGTFALDDILKVYEAALDASAAAGLKSVLVDVRELAGRPPTTLERYEMGVRVAKLQSEPSRRMPLVIVGSEPIIDPQRFGETVARNRGAIGKVFTDIDQAIAWINDLSVG